MKSKTLFELKEQLEANLASVKADLASVNRTLELLKAQDIGVPTKVETPNVESNALMTPRQNFVKLQQTYGDGGCEEAYGKDEADKNVQNKNPDNWSEAVTQVVKDLGNGGATYTVKDINELLESRYPGSDPNRNTIYGILSVLKKQGVIRVDEEKKGRKNAFYATIENPAVDNQL